MDSGKSGTKSRHTYAQQRHRQQHLPPSRRLIYKPPQRHALGHALLLLLLLACLASMVPLGYSHVHFFDTLFHILRRSVHSPSQTPSQMQSQTHTSTCALSLLDFNHLAADWGTTSLKVAEAASASAFIFGCAADDKSFIRSVFLLAKDVTERDALVGFDKAKLMLHPIPPAPADGRSPYLAFFLKDSNIIAGYFRQRLDRLLDDGDVETSAFDLEADLNAFVVLHPEWSNTTLSYISLLANPKLRRSMISRVQLTGLCFLHAPLVALHYAINLIASESNNATVDITTALRHNFDDGILGSYLFADKGWWTQDIIEKVFEPDPGAPIPRVLDFSIQFPSSSAQSGRDYSSLHSNLVNYGVGIITTFDVDVAFWNASATSFSGTVLTKFIGGHSMVLIGVRFDEKVGQYYLLLQNWWNTLQIVEVRQDYASVNHAHLCFVETPQRAYRKNWRTVTFRSANSAAESAGVEFPRQTY